MHPDSIEKKQSFQKVRLLLERYFRGQAVDFRDLEVDLSGLRPFTTKVLMELRKIPYGHLSSYLKIGKQVGYAMAARAVGQAVKRNAIPIIIPCHRVIREDGSLGGFSLGIEIKKRLLVIEGVFNSIDKTGLVLTESHEMISKALPGVDGYCFGSIKTCPDIFFTSSESKKSILEIVYHLLLAVYLDRCNEVVKCTAFTPSLRSLLFTFCPTTLSFPADEFQIGPAQTQQSPFDENPRTCSTYQVSFCSVTATFFQLPDAKRKAGSITKRAKPQKSEHPFSCSSRKDLILYVFIALFVWKLYFLPDW